MSASDNTAEINEDNAETQEVLQKGLDEKVKAYEAQCEVIENALVEYEAQCEVIENALVEYALEHNLHLNLEDYGSGRTLLLEDNKWVGKQRGEWLYSSDNC